MRKLLGFAALLAGACLASAQEAGAGLIGSLNVQDGHVLIAEVAPDVKAVTAAEVLNASWAWFFVIQDTAVSVTNPTITVDSGYPVSAFPGGVGGASFPVSLSQATLNAGEAFFPNANFLSNIPTTMSPGFDSTRSLSTEAIPVGGGHQQLTITITPRTTLPNYKVAIYNSVPGVVVTQLSGPAGLNDLQTGSTYTLTYDLNVPNPFGVPFAYQPNVHVNGGSDSISCCVGPTSQVSVPDPTLDGGTVGRGNVTYSANETVANWSIDTGSFFEVSYGGLLLPLPSSKTQCKDEGWRTFGVFNNQGDCVSYVATDGTNLPG